MPRYSYICKACEYQYDIMHSYKMILEDCPECDHTGTLEKMLNNFTTNIEKYNQDRKVGSVVKESIEEFRQELKEDKENFMNRDYKE